MRVGNRRCLYSLPLAIVPFAGRLARGFSPIHTSSAHDEPLHDTANVDAHILHARTQRTPTHPKKHMRANDTAQNCILTHTKRTYTNAHAYPRGKQTHAHIPPTPTCTHTELSLLRRERGQQQPPPAAHVRLLARTGDQAVIKDWGMWTRRKGHRSEGRFLCGVVCSLSFSLNSEKQVTGALKDRGVWTRRKGHRSEGRLLLCVACSLSFSLNIGEPSHETPAHLRTEPRVRGYWLFA